MDEKKEQSKEKPLENMTVKELREIAKEMPEITGVHGKNKAELFNAVRKARGIIDKTPKKKDSTVQGIKQRIRELKTKRMAAAESHDKKMVSIYRRRISRLKKEQERLHSRVKFASQMIMKNTESIRQQWHLTSMAYLQIPWRFL